MKTIIIKMLPYVLMFGIGGWLVYDVMSTKNELNNMKWELATMKNRAETAEYSLEQEKKHQLEREEFRKELDKQFKTFDLKLGAYTKQLQAIKDERNKSGINNSLSSDVSRVLKDFNQDTD